MAKEDQIDRKINTVIDQMCAKFENKFKEQDNRINAQCKEITSLKQANAYYANAQSQWSRVVNELQQIKVLMNKVFGLLRRSNSVTPTNVNKKANVPLVNDKLKDEDEPAQEKFYSTPVLQLMCAVTSANLLRGSNLTVLSS
ncbi:hypothetical protein MJO28_002433 [Puccinia striiformis f. sp. tritici]|uniref:Uncharacterized protein n=1 Tax=Puccinia striiformis f. sp. tritici TaxID=168172 RepID=A0ACC0ES34_9BASI|nr:hypothetical protein MJO28_002433 [Puccinia striiformis f. sp. tritici]